MTTPDKIEEIRKACIEANPEIVELEFGCLFQIKGAKYPQPIIGIKWKENEDTGIDEIDYFRDIYGGKVGYTNSIEIIGRPIRLADILLAIEVKLENRKDNEILKMEEFQHVTSNWILSQENLEKQKEYLISFIHNVLIKE